LEGADGDLSYRLRGHYFEETVRIGIERWVTLEIGEDFDESASRVLRKVDDAFFSCCGVPTTVRTFTPQTFEIIVSDDAPEIEPIDGLGVNTFVDLPEHRFHQTTP